MCGQCVQVCSSYASILDEGIAPREQKLAERAMLPSVKEPLFAAYNQGKALKVKEALADPDKYVMVQVAAGGARGDRRGVRHAAGQPGPVARWPRPCAGWASTGSTPPTSPPT